MPRLDVPVSSEFCERAAMRYRKQYDLWHMYEPPFFARSPVDASRGGLSLTEVHTQLLEADESYEKWGFDTDAAPLGQALYSLLFASDPIEWNRAQPTALQRRSAPTTQPPGTCLQEVLICAQVLATSRM